jgi:hypothetical protein
MRVPLSGGTAVALADKLDEPWLLASDGASLYWTEGQIGHGKVRKLDLAPGAEPVTLIDGQAHPRAIAVRDGFVYWTDVDDGTILRAPDHLLGPADGGVRTASRLASGLSKPTDLLLIGDFAYVPDQLGHIQRVPLAGGDLEEVAAVDGAPYGIATDGRSLYWTVLGNGGGLFAAPPAACAGCKFPALVPDQIDPHFIAVTADSLYWSTWGTNPAIHRLAK